ncbi:MAG: hypothetical protein PHQ19_04810 [Candidatus Krumholzibacteria bacterium]|nr:hypothetical protein [Candidatus Krumholzibacteria bacterium]
MSAMKQYAVVTLFLMTAAVISAGCDDTNYDQRTVVYVSNVNDGMPFLSDVLQQGDSLYYDKTTTLKLEDDYIEEDWLKVEIHNKPYNAFVEPEYSLGDFLLTGYEVSFVQSDGTAGPIPAFSGETSILVPADSKVEAYIVLVPFNTKTVSPLVDMQYTNLEIYSNARVTFHGHEVQTDREIEFSCGIHVNFADPLTLENDR